MSSCSRSSVAFFALCAAYIWWCDRIIGPDVDNAVDTGADDATVATQDEEALAS